MLQLLVARSALSHIPPQPEPPPPVLLAAAVGPTPSAFVRGPAAGLLPGLPPPFPCRRAGARAGRECV